MGLFHYLFGFSGRINRAKQWAILLVGLTFEFLVVVAFSLIVGFATVGGWFDQHMSLKTILALRQVQAFGLTLCVLYLLMLFISVAVGTKRLHDRDKSAWWLLLYYLLPLILSVPTFGQVIYVTQHLDAFVKAAQAGAAEPMLQTPLSTIASGASSIISLIAFVELFCLPGTSGDNRYGPDPLAPRLKDRVK